MSRVLEVLHDDVLILGEYLREAIGACEEINRLTGSLCARRLQVRHAPDVEQPDPTRDLARDS